jgi:hypothetical protein
MVETCDVTDNEGGLVRFQVLTAANMKFRFVFWDVLPCKIIVYRRFRGAYCLHHQGFSLRRPGFALRSVHMKFVMKKVALEQVFHRDLRVSLIRVILPTLHIHCVFRAGRTMGPLASHFHVNSNGSVQRT